MSSLFKAYKRSFLLKDRGSDIKRKGVGFLVNTIVAVIILQISPFTINSAFAESYDPIIIITVDVETANYYNDSFSLTLPEQVNAVCEQNRECGLQRMVGLLKQYNYPATFYFNVYEYKEYGEQPIMEIAQWLNESGQDVQLHTHPQWAYDESRNLMHQYSLNEQIQIIKEGKDLLESWTGQPVLAHRAGAYGADENTIRALIRNNIYYDSSLLVFSGNSKIRKLNFKKNTLSMYGDLYEFPVTVYKLYESPFFLKDNVKPVSVMSKYDVDFFHNEIETEKALREALELKMDIIILFLHSFSFIKAYDDSENMKSDVTALKVFEYMLEFIRNKKLKVLSFRNIKDSNIELEKYLKRPDTIPEISMQISTLQYLRKRIGINRRNYKTYALITGAAILLILIGVAALKRRRN